MRKIQFSILFLLVAFLPSAYSQRYFYQTLKGLPESHSRLIRQAKQPADIDTVNYLIDYYLSDSYLYRNSYRSQQKQLMNHYYNYPRDTANHNYACINSISVAFDSLIHDTVTIQPFSLLTIAIDTLYIPIIQKNRDFQNDTLTIQLTSVNGNGYPNTGTYLIDTTIIDSANHWNNIGNNDGSVRIIKWPLRNYQLLGNTRFAVNVNYYDPAQRDSCWFIYGYGYFNSTCPFEANTTTFANVTHFSNISNNIKPFNANSFVQWNEYTGYGFFPTGNGDNVFFPCTAADTDSYQPGIDGASYFQNIDMYASIQLVQNTGIAKINSTGISVGQNYPNPFTATSTITYSITQPSNLSFRAYDLTGREVLSQNLGIQEPGQHTILISGNDLQPGIYFYSITSSGYSVTKKMVVY